MSTVTLTLTLTLRDPAYHRHLMGAPWPMRHLSIEFCENRLNSFYVTLLTNKQTNYSANENITSLAEV